MRRTVRTRRDASTVGHRIERDADALWRAISLDHGARSPIRDDEAEPIAALRYEAKRVARLLGRRRSNGRKNHAG